MKTSVDNPVIEKPNNNMDKSIKHTKGPWMCEELPDGKSDTTIVYGGFPLATVRGTNDMSCIDEEDEEEIAIECVLNAKLIAAAPDLLEALNMCLRCMDGPRIPKYMELPVKMAKEAIKKATA